MQITIDLTDEQVKRLTKVAQSLAVEFDELARAIFNDLLSNPSDEFQKAASHVLSKNKELYERLS